MECIVPLFSRRCAQDLTYHTLHVGIRPLQDHHVLANSALSFLFSQEKTVTVINEAKKSFSAMYTTLVASAEIVALLFNVVLQTEWSSASQRQRNLGDGMMKFALADTEPDIAEENVSQVDGVCRRGNQLGGDGVRATVRHRIQQHLPHATCRYTSPITKRFTDNQATSAVVLCKPPRPVAEAIKTAVWMI